VSHSVTECTQSDLLHLELHLWKDEGPPPVTNPSERDNIPERQHPPFRELSVALLVGPRSRLLGAMAHGTNSHSFTSYPRAGPLQCDWGIWW
jgi:hypothetical protein